MAVATKSRKPKDPILEGAVDVARAAAQETADVAAHVGEHLGATVDAERLVSHRFAATMPGYRGWHWTVTLARVPRGRAATVCEVELLPGDDAILAPEWLPWSDRLRPGDVGPTDILPFKADDPRLEPGFVPTGDGDVDVVAIEELALARARVLSQDGIAEAAQRWYDGDAGPRAPQALGTPGDCQTCGFLVPLQGSLGQVFGVCTNPWSPDDGKVVAFDHGCGAHSETDVPEHPSEWPAPSTGTEPLEIDVRTPASDAPAQDAPAQDAPAQDAPEQVAVEPDAPAQD